MDIIRTSQTSPAASAPHGGTEDRGIAACSLFQAINCDILHFPEGGWGRNGAPWNAGGNLSEPCWGWQGRQQPTGKAAQEMPQGKPFSSTGRVFFMVRALQLSVEEVRSQPFSQGLF